MILNKIGGVAMSMDNNTKFIVGDEVTILSNGSHTTYFIQNHYNTYFASS